MPIWLRRFTHQQIADYHKKEQDAINKSSKSPNSTTANIGDTKIPEHIKQAFKGPKRSPSYKTKASKK